MRRVLLFSATQPLCAAPLLPSTTFPLHSQYPKKENRQGALSRKNPQNCVPMPVNKGAYPLAKVLHCLCDQEKTNRTPHTQSDHKPHYGNLAKASRNGNRFKRDGQ